MSAMHLIVVLDDDAGTRMLANQTLKKDGDEIFDAEDGANGLALICKHIV